MALEHSTGYVPGFAHDLFFSYARNDSAEWIRALEESLHQHLRERLGLDVGIWKDKNNIRFGQNWTDEIHEAIRSSAAFLAILSPSYRNSEWCARERKLFLDEVRTQLKAGSYHRFLKLIKLPWPDDEHEQFHEELEHIDFFKRLQAGEGNEYLPGTREFGASVENASWAIASLLREMRRRLEKVFIGASTGDIFHARAELAAELHAQGYVVLPEGPIDSGFAPRLIKKTIEPAILSVHILGARYDPFDETQIDLAIELEKRVVFWVTRDAETSQDPEQRKLIERIRHGQKQQGRWDLLKSRSDRAVFDEIVGMLRPKAAPPPPKTESGPKQIYLLCDPTTPEDAALAREIQTQIRQIEKMDVQLPGGDARTVTARSDLHQRLLRESDGLLLCRQAAPEPWLFHTLPDVLYAERLVQRPKVLSKAFLVNDASILQGFTGVSVIPQSQPFVLSDLDPFLAPLRKAGSYAAD
jgi:hypothetical protein